MKPCKEVLTSGSSDVAYYLDRSICRALADMPETFHDFGFTLWKTLIFATRRVTELRPK